MAILTFMGGTSFWLQFRGLDKQEDQLNMLPTGLLGTNKEAELEVERHRPTV
jgi:proton-dependent oligopeptide transporter, POT family